MRLFFWLVLFAVVLYSCKKSSDSAPQQPPQLKSNVANIILGAVTGSKDSIIITSNVNWTISISPSVTWASLSVSSGSNNGKVYVTAIQDNTDNAQKSASITLTPVGTTSVQPINIPLTQNFQNLQSALQINGLSIQWAKPFGTGFIDNGNTIATTADGGFIVAGASNGNPWAAKCDGSGALTWQKPIGDASLSGAADCIITTADGGYAIAGWVFKNNTIDLWVTRMNGSGDTLWQKILGGNDRSFSGIDGDNAKSIAATADGGFIVAGYTFTNDRDVSGNHGICDFWVIKFDGSGNVTWKKVLGGSDSDQAISVINANDGGYIIAGYSKSNDGDVSGNHGDYDGWIVKLSNAGDLVWQRSIGGTARDFILSIVATPDNTGYVIAGETESTNGNFSSNHGRFDAWIVKLDNTGTVTWQKLIGTSYDDEATSVLVNSNGEVVFAGQSNTASTIGDFFTGRLSSDGNLLSQGTIGNVISPGTDDGKALIAVGEYYLATLTTENNSIPGYHGGNADALAVKFKFQQ